MTGNLLYIVFIGLFIYCSLTAAYLFLLAFMAKFFYRDRLGSASAMPQKRIAILVPAYREDGIIISTAQNLLQLNYPRELYDIYIIADSFQAETLERLRMLPIKVVEVSFEKSTKTKSLNEAFSRIGEPYDIALICDADNVLARNFLLKINTAFQNGARAVQGRRVAKNLDTAFAILDACSEGINNNMFRKGANALGLSSSVIGSGMAFDFRTIRDILASISAIGGFDKILQLKLVEQGIRIHYLADALIFDEKVDSPHAFRQQRKRWVSTQFIYLKQFFRPAISQLFKGNISYFDLAIIKNLILPRAFLLAIFPLLILFSFLLPPGWVFGSIGIFLLYLSGLLIALPMELINRDLFHAVLRLPRAIGVMLGTIFHLKRANRSFIHTVHTKTEINNPLFNEHTS